MMKVAIYSVNQMNNCKQWMHGYMLRHCHCLLADVWDRIQMAFSGK